MTPRLPDPEHNRSRSSDAVMDTNSGIQKVSVIAVWLDCFSLGSHSPDHSAARMGSLQTPAIDHPSKVPSAAKRSSTAPRSKARRELEMDATGHNPNLHFSRAENYPHTHTHTRTHARTQTLYVADIVSQTSMPTGRDLRLGCSDHRLVPLDTPAWSRLQRSGLRHSNPKPQQPIRSHRSGV